MGRRGEYFEYEPKAEVLVWELRETKKYLPDFKIRDFIVECKGRLTAADRKKMLHVRDQHPEKDIRLLFQFDNKLNPRSKTRYSAWAEKNGFKWALKEVPEEWLSDGD